MTDMLPTHRFCIKQEFNGFTLLEIIAVLVILGVLAAVGVSRLSGVWITAYGDADRLVSDLRYAQSLAMTQASKVDANNQVRINIHNDGWEFANNADGKWRFADGKKTREVRWGVEAQDTSIGFSYPRGKPEIDSDQAITLSKDGNQLDIIVHAKTGYIEIQ